MSEVTTCDRIECVCPYCGTNWITRVDPSNGDTITEIDKCYCEQFFNDQPSEQEKQLRATTLLKKREDLLEAAHQRFLDLLGRLHVKRPNQLAQQVFLAYAEPHRFYHNIDHILFCLAQYDTFAPEPHDWLEAAIWLHDVVYRPGYSGVRDEELSASWAASRLCSKWSPVETQIHALILATDHSCVDEFGGSADYIVDVDLSILGTSSFGSYEKKIRREFGGVADRKYSRGRTEFLRRFLDSRPDGYIYRTEIFRGRYEKAAQANIQQLLEQLADGGSD